MNRNFCSDNATGAAPAIFKAIADVNAGAHAGYGADPYTARATARVREAFETDAAVFLVPTGSAANALGLSTLTPPWGAVICHTRAHANTDECGATETFSGGAKMLAVDGDGDWIREDDLRATLTRIPKKIHQAKPTTLCITQATVPGTVYSLDEVRALCDVAHEFGLKVYLDGARLANAVARLGCSLAEATWRAGVDIACMGGTKNGLLYGEAVMVFDPSLAEAFEYRRKVFAQLMSKMRFVAAQFDVYLSDGMWLRHAAHANAMATRLAEGLAAIPGIELEFPVEANLVFLRMPKAIEQGLRNEGFEFFTREPGTLALVRMVTAYDTEPDDIDALIAAARRLIDGA